MSERKLATIQKVVEINPIEKYDRVQLATILGWRCIVKINEFKVGNLGIYLEIDSEVPANKICWEFMQKRKYRVKTLKMCGVISQGLFMPLAQDEIGFYVPDEYRVDNIKSRVYVEEGSDVTELLGITKWESESDKEANAITNNKRKYNWLTKFMTRFEWYRKLTKTKSKSFPNWISKTDETRLQNMPWILEKMKDQSFILTEKLDGQSVTYWYKKQGWFGNEFGICSRTVRKFELDNSNWSVVARKLEVKNKLKLAYSLYGDIAIQGEIIGPTIQGNKYKLTEMDLYVFNVFDIKNKRYFNINERLTFCGQFGFKHVPVLNFNFKLKDTIDEMVKYSTAKSVINDNTDREGIVIRTEDQSISFKVISPEWLLKHEE